MTLDSPNSTDDFTPATQLELSRFVAENASRAKQPLVPVGGRTALHYGNPLADEGRFLSTSRLTQIVDYPARDMTITVEAGTRLEQLAETLRAQGQQLPVDVAQAHRATLGGALATNTSGPRRYGYGTLRDYVIGISAVDAGGRLFHSGGRVVKNVAGYDLCKLLVGSLGTLAVVTQVTLKLKPLPESCAFLWATFGSFSDIDSALAGLLTSSARPVAIEVLNPLAARQVAAEAKQDLPCESPVLAIGVDGTGSEVDWQMEALSQELSRYPLQEEQAVTAKRANLLLNALTEFQAISDDPVTFLATMLPSATMAFVELAPGHGVSVQAHAGSGVVIGHLPDRAVTVEQVAEIVTALRALAASHRGHLVIFNCDNDWKPALKVFGDPKASWPLMQKLKQSLDPDHLLNPGKSPW
jgi:glycolate oxidase FAD binding subunit